MYRDDQVVCVGSVGTVQSEKCELSHDKLWTPSDARRRTFLAFTSQIKKRVWLQPTSASQIEYRAWTHEVRQRHPAYIELRERQDSADVRRID
ncbi:hypothetical protein [Pararhizobium arenae]|uniref:ATP dependent DNA ligase n=1 Tax=Pararhizobium arenae TaxID=1856850 RepID=UPI003CC9DC08